MQIDDELEAKYDNAEEKQVASAAVRAGSPTQNRGAAAAIVEPLDLPDLVPVHQDVPLDVVASSSNVCHSLPQKRFNRKSAFICMDENGTVRRKKRRGSTKFNEKLDLQLPAIPKLVQEFDMQSVFPRIQQYTHSMLHHKFNQQTTQRPLIQSLCHEDGQDLDRSPLD